MIYIGALSGTSMDQVDAVAGIFHKNQFEIIASHSEPITDDIRNALRHLQQHPNTAQCFAQLDTQLGELFALACEHLIKHHRLSRDEIGAIGLHGQTIIHHAPSYSMQIGNPCSVAIRTRLPVVTDFRRMDMALGGQGAPLSCAFHETFFSHPKEARAIVNIGGIANVSLLSPQGKTQGFDCGPGNILLDQWIQQRRHQNYDNNGDWASSATYDKDLLQALCDDSLLSDPACPSLCASYFDTQWLQQKCVHLYKPDVVQATLAELTAVCIQKALDKHQAHSIFICGGGAKNSHLLNRIHTLCNSHVATTEALGIAPQLVEGLLFAWLAKKRIYKEKIALSHISGAQRDTLLGCIYQAQ
ncbi:MAG: anhydro-N-acetylmuramic acid kinase [Candidatus Oxydemutatoraceae bacterium WSBS_2016_MAG_OTU14]